jgi:hypothetical protein
MARSMNLKGQDMRAPHQESDDYMPVSRPVCTTIGRYWEGLGGLGRAVGRGNSTRASTLKTLD